MKDIHYQISFHTFWHCGSGLSAGADVDALVVKNADGLPYIPGKTLKGLLRESAELLLELNPQKYASASWNQCVGDMAEDGDASTQGTAFFSDARLAEGEATVICANSALAKYLYKSVAATAIDDQTGTVREHSLRKMQVTVPCVLYGSVCDVPDDCVDLLADSMKMVKRLGSGRNRGLGRCTMKVWSGKERMS